MKVRKFGFTLIELLVVIVIIAILAAILFPVFAKVREKARETSCASNLKQLALGFLQYNQDYDERFPIGWDGDKPTSWPQEVAPYIKSDKVFACPDDSLAGAVDTTQAYLGIRMSYAVNGEVWFNWGDPNPAHLVGPSGNINAWSSDSTGKGALAIGEIVDPSRSILLNERWDKDCTKQWGSGSGNFATKWDHNNVTDGNDMALPCPSQATTGFDTGADGSVSVHQDGMSNFAFTDGHVKAMHPSATHPGASGYCWNDNADNLWDTTRNGNAPY
jgi:prepilin-type N-terminal cleavage/methylation domain-containing protein/prepilin-type processing-associated H-X9-DG protein